MNKIIGYAIFISIFLIIYLGMHYYVFWRLGYLLSIKQKIWHYIPLLILTVLFPVASIIERSFSNGFIRAFYTISAIWIGMIFFLFFSLVIFEIFNAFIKIPKYEAGIFILIAAGIITFISIITALNISIQTIQIPMENLDKDYKIVQLSDVHIGTVHNSRYLKNIVADVNSIDPDFVVITGDLFDGSGKLVEYNISSLNDINADIFFVTGNHERYIGLDEVFGLLNKTKIKIIRNQVIDYGGIQIVGVDDGENEFTKENPVLKGLEISKSMPSILLFHRPIGLEDANNAGIDLQLSGHTHRGQMFPFTIFVKLFYPKDHGLYKYKDLNLYVSQGTGTWGPPMRFLSRSEITVINLVKN